MPVGIKRVRTDHDSLRFCGIQYDVFVGLIGSSMVRYLINVRQQFLPVEFYQLILRSILLGNVIINEKYCHNHIYYLIK